MCSSGNEYSIFVVDDVESGRRMLESTLGQIYSVESFESGAACLARLEEKIPNVFLLDVDMPVMDGYTLCREIKSRSGSKATPVIFISGLDDLESRLSGYDAGGDDFIVKPYKVAILKQKIEVFLRIAEEKSALLNRLDESDMLASLVMSNLDEYAVLIQFLRSLNSYEQYSDLADEMLKLLKGFKLSGAIQLRLLNSEINKGQEGEVTPLEASILRQIGKQGSIVAFKNRTSFNYGRVTVIISNMPTEDPDLCGRLRDHLAIAVETLNAKVLALLTLQENISTKGDIADLLQSLGGTVHDVSKKVEKARLLSADSIRNLMADLDVEFAQLGLLDSQEFAIKDLIQSRMDNSIDINDFSSDVEKTLADISTRLGQVGTTSDAGVRGLRVN